MCLDSWKVTIPHFLGSKGLDRYFGSLRLRSFGATYGRVATFFFFMFFVFFSNNMLNTYGFATGRLAMPF